MNRKCIVVLGMHRSGTSAITGFLCNTGISIGKSIMPPKPDNPAGFFENLKIQELNDDILSSLGSNWDDIYPLSDDWLDSTHLNSYYQQANKLITEEFENDALFIIKDPRLSLLLPFWSKVLERLNISIVVTFVLRNPFEIASSLEYRNKFELNKSLHLIAKYWKHGESCSRANKRVFIDFEGFVDQPETTKEILKSNFNLPFKESKRAEFKINKSLKHFNFEDDIEKSKSDKELSSLLIEIYQNLKQLGNADTQNFEENSTLDKLFQNHLKILPSKVGFHSKFSLLIKKLGLSK